MPNTTSQVDPLTAFIEAKKRTYAKPPQVLADLSKRRSAFAAPTAAERRVAEMKFPDTRRSRLNRDIVHTGKNKRLSKKQMSAQAAQAAAKRHEEEKEQLCNALQKLVDSYAPLLQQSEEFQPMQIDNPTDDEQFEPIEESTKQRVLVVRHTPQKGVEPEMSPSRRAIVEALETHDRVTRETEEALARAQRSLGPVRAQSTPGSAKRSYVMPVQIEDDEDDSELETCEVPALESSFRQRVYEV